MSGPRLFRCFIAAALTVLAFVPTPTARASGTNCVTLLLASSADSSGITPATQVDLGCYGTFAEALAVGSSGAIEVPGSITPDALTDAMVAGDIGAATSSVLIGTEWDGTGYTGVSQNYFAAATCSTGVTWEVADVTATWDNVFSSGKGFGGCDINKKFQNVNFGGNVVTCTPNCSNYGSLSNQVSSLRWKP